MGTGDPRAPRPTVRLDHDELQKLTRAAGGPGGGEVTTPALAEGSEPAPAIGRAATVHDPMTMALLAEVARTSRTMDLDAEQLEQVRASLAGEPAPTAEAEPAPGATAAAAHPNLRRR